MFLTILYLDVCTVKTQRWAIPFVTFIWKERFYSLLVWIRVEGHYLLESIFTYFRKFRVELGVWILSAPTYFFLIYSVEAQLSNVLWSNHEPLRLHMKDFNIWKYLYIEIFVKESNLMVSCEFSFSWHATKDCKLKFV